MTLAPLTSTCSGAVWPGAPATTTSHEPTALPAVAVSVVRDGCVKVTSPPHGVAAELVTVNAPP